MHLHCTIRNPEMRPPSYSVKRTLHMAPTASSPIETHPHRGHFANKFVGSLVKQEELKARNSTRAARYLSAMLVYLPCALLWGHRSHYTTRNSIKSHPSCNNNACKAYTSIILLGPRLEGLHCIIRVTVTARIGTCT